MSFFNLKKLGVVGTGFLTVEAINQSFDWILFPLVIGFFGPIKGGAVMFVIALTLNFSLILVYNKTKSDWFGFEWLRNKEAETETRTSKIVRVALRFGRWPGFVLLSWEDPFKAFVFIRGRSSAENGFDRTDWIVFLSANLIGVLIWIIMVSGALELLKRVV